MGPEVGGTCVGDFREFGPAICVGAVFGPGVRPGGIAVGDRCATADSEVRADAVMPLGDSGCRVVRCHPETGHPRPDGDTCTTPTRPKLLSVDRDRPGRVRRRTCAGPGRLWYLLYGPLRWRVGR